MFDNPDALVFIVFDVPACPEFLMNSAFYLFRPMFVNAYLCNRAHVRIVDFQLISMPSFSDHGWSSYLDKFDLFFSLREIWDKPQA